MIETQTRQITNHNLSQTKKMIRLKNIEKVYRTDTVETPVSYTHLTLPTNREV